MLTGFQLETVAYVDENGELFCPDCFDRGDVFARPVIRYSLDEEELVRSYDAFEEDEDHVEECDCAWPIQCDGCATDLTEGYTDPRCEEKQEVSTRA